MLEYEVLTNVFSKIIANPDEARQALEDPSSVFTKYGLNVPDPEATNSMLFEAVPQLRAHFLAAARAKPHENALLGCSSPGCIACQAGLVVSLAPYIPLALSPAATIASAALASIAGLLGLPRSVVNEIINAGAPQTHAAIVEKLCAAMGAC